MGLPLRCPGTVVFHIAAVQQAVVQHPAVFLHQRIVAQQAVHLDQFAQDDETRALVQLRGPLAVVVDRLVVAAQMLVQGCIEQQARVVFRVAVVVAHVQIVLRIHRIGEHLLAELPFGRQGQQGEGRQFPIFFGHGRRHRFQQVVPHPVERIPLDPREALGPLDGGAEHRPGGCGQHQRGGHGQVGPPCLPFPDRQQERQQPQHQQDQQHRYGRLGLRRAGQEKPQHARAQRGERIGGGKAPAGQDPAQQQEHQRHDDCRDQSPVHRVPVELDQEIGQDAG